jgi:FkbM family methyltransferase
MPFKRELFELLRGRVRLPRRVYQHLHFAGPFEVHLEYGCSFRIYSTGATVENDLFWSGYGRSWEATSLRVWAALCRNRSGLVLDVGANTGVYALAAAALAPKAEVVAFEPVDRMAQQLARNVELNGFPITIELAAVTDHSGSVSIYDAMIEHNYSASLEGQGRGAACYEVRAISVDDWLSAKEGEKVDAIKLDIERHEPTALRGMQHLLRSQRPPMLIEILDRSAGQQIEELIDGLNYRLFHIEEDRGLIPADQLRPLRDHHWNHLLCDIEAFDRAGLARFVVG